MSATFFGSLAVYGKLAARMGIPLTELLAIRFGGAAVVLWALALVRRERPPTPRSAGATAVMGFLYVGQAMTYFTSLRTVPAAVTSILLYLYPVVVVLLAALLLGERLTRARALALVLACAGVFAVIDPLAAQGSVDGPGIGFGLATAVIYATYILAGRVLLAGVSSVIAGAGIATTAGIALATVGAVTGQMHALTGAGWALVLSMSVVATAVPATLFLAGLARVGATRAAIVSTLEPVVTVVLAAVVLGEALGPVRLAGGAIVLTAAVVVARNVPPELVEPRARE